jgi:hypothetical protein
MAYQSKGGHGSPVAPYGRDLCLTAVSAADGLSTLCGPFILFICFVRVECVDSPQDRISKVIAANRGLHVAGIEDARGFEPAFGR